MYFYCSLLHPQMIENILLQVRNAFCIVLVCMETNIYALRHLGKKRTELKLKFSLIYLFIHWPCYGWNGNKMKYVELVLWNAVTVNLFRHVFLSILKTQRTTPLSKQILKSSHQKKRYHITYTYYFYENYGKKTHSFYNNVHISILFYLTLLA